ncbi:MAG: hypothetical protein HUU57_13905, partial [Bdellovibrio sp.]|nr:hypothetical protein [Bdellovibrio sp.]
MSNKKALFHSLVILIALVFTNEVQAQHKGINFQTVIKKPDGTYPTVSGLTVTAQILDPVNNCVLREEIHTGKNISNGYLNLTLGDVSASTPGGRNPSPVLTVVEVMDNRTTRSGLKCVDENNNIVLSGQSYIPSNIDRRILRVRMNIQGEDVAADFNMRAVGFAVNSEMLNSKTDLDFININGAAGVSQSNLDSIFNRFTKLDAILNGFNADGTSAGINISGNAASATNVTGTVAVANGGTGQTTLAGTKMVLGIGTIAAIDLPSPLDATKVLRGDGTWTALPVSSGGTVTGVTAGAGLVHVTDPGNPLVTAGELAVNVGTGSNQIVQMTGDGKLPVVDGSNLTGVIASALSNSASINTSGNIVTSGNVQAGSSITTKNIYLYDTTATPASIGLKTPADIIGAGGASYVLTLPEKMGATGQVLAAKDNFGNLQWISPSLGSVTGVSADAPILIDSSVASSPKVTIPRASTLTSGYLDATDWNTFNSKQSPGNYLTTLTGDVSSSSFVAGSVSAKVEKINGVAVSAAVAGDDQKFMKFVNGAGWQPHFVRLSEL